MREQAEALRATGRKDEAAHLERTATALAPTSAQPKKSRAGGLAGLLELVAVLLNPFSLVILLLASMVLPVIPWIAVAYYRVTPGRPGSRRSIIGWIFQGVRAGRLGPFVLGLAFGLVWLAILGPYALADTDPGLRAFIEIIATFTALCAARIVTARVAGRERYRH